MARGEHGLQDPDIIKAMDSGNMKEAQKLAQAKLNKPIWFVGLAALLAFLILRK